MNACQLISFDLGQCVSMNVQAWLGPYFGWLAYWPWAAAVVGVIVVLWLLNLAKGALGEPGETLMAGALGFIAGVFIAMRKLKPAPAPKPQQPRPKK